MSVLVVNSSLAPQSNAVVGTRVVVVITLENIWNIANTTLRVGVILTGACLPAAVIIDVCFPRWVYVAEEPSWEDRNGILHVGDANKGVQGIVDEVGKGLISDLKDRAAALRWDEKNEIKM